MIENVVPHLAHEYPAMKVTRGNARDAALMCGWDAASALQQTLPMDFVAPIPCMNLNGRTIYEGQWLVFLESRNILVYDSKELMEKEFVLAVDNTALIRAYKNLERIYGQEKDNERE